jgi:hypothetical protein
LNPSSGEVALKRADRPPARFVLWSTILGTSFALAALLFGVAVHDQRQRTQDQRTFSPVVGTVVEANDDGSLQIGYFHGPVNEQVVARLWTYTVDLQKYDVGDSIDVLSDPDNPYTPQAPGDLDTTGQPIVFIALFTLGPLGLIVAASWSRQRLGALATSNKATLRMMAASVPSRRGRVPRWNEMDRDDDLWNALIDQGAATECDRVGHLNALHDAWASTPGSGRYALYPLDAAIGSAPSCVVRIHPTVAVPPDDGIFPVDVKGSPRPGGRLVMRTSSGIVWTRGRCLLTADWPRPAHSASDHRTGTNPSAGLSPVSDVLASATVGSDGPEALGRQRKRELPEPIVGLVSTLEAALVIGAGITALATRAGLESSQADSLRRVEVVARVVNHRDTDIEVEFRLPGRDESTLALAPVSYPEDFPIGNVYPALARPNGSAVRLRTQPYDWVEPVIWWMIPATPLAIWAVVMWAGWWLGLVPSRRPVEVRSDIALSLARRRALSPSAGGGPADGANEAGAEAIRWLKQRTCWALATTLLLAGLFESAIDRHRSTTAWKREIRQIGTMDSAVVETVVDESGKNENDQIRLRVGPSQLLATVDEIDVISRYRQGETITVWYESDQLEHTATEWDENSDSSEDLAEILAIFGGMALGAAVIWLALLLRGFVAVRGRKFRWVTIVAQAEKRKSKGAVRTLLCLNDSSEVWSTMSDGPSEGSSSIVVAGHGRWLLVAGSSPYVLRQPWWPWTRNNWSDRLNESRGVASIPLRPSASNNLRRRPGRQRRRYRS